MLGKLPLLLALLFQSSLHGAYREANVTARPFTRVVCPTAGIERGCQHRDLVVQMLQAVRVRRRLQLFTLCLQPPQLLPVLGQGSCVALCLNGIRGPRLALLWRNGHFQLERRNRLVRTVQQVVQVTCPQRVGQIERLPPPANPPPNPPPQTETTN